jgi:NADH:ubiquinone oxidoreductase subunit H
MYLYSCICLLLVTVIVVVFTAVERKVISFLQHRFGLKLLDYPGRLHFIAVMLAGRFLDKDKGFFMPTCGADNL